MSDQVYIIHTDGGSRGNPGPAATGYVIYDHNRTLLFDGGTYLGKATNNVAEYQAVIDALEHLVKKECGKGSTLHFYLDSNLVVQQLKGNFKIKQAHLRELATAIHHLVKENDFKVTYQHVRRESNHQADLMVNQILDAHLA